jgi:hypothetical protein
MNLLEKKIQIHKKIIAIILSLGHKRGIVKF